MNNPFNRGERQRQRRLEALDAEIATLENKLEFAQAERDSLLANPALGRVTFRHLHLVPDLVELEL